MKRIHTHILFWSIMLIFFALLFVPIGCGGDDGDGGGGNGDTGTVSGTVLDESGNPVDGATCTIITTDGLSKGTYSDISAGDGAFEILNVPVGNWPLYIDKAGYLTTTVDVSVSGGQTTQVPTDETVVTPGTPTPSPTSTSTTTPTPSPTSTGTSTPTPSPTSSGGGGGGGSTGSTVWKWKNPVPQGDYSIRSLYIANNIAIFVGTNGMIWRSADNGATWNKVNTGVNVQYNAVWGSADGQNWYVVGGTDGTRGVVLYSSNSGQTFTQQTHANIPNLNLFGVYGASDGTNVFVVGASNGVNGTILYSAQGDGTDWAVQSASAPNVEMRAVWASDDASHVYAVGASNGAVGTCLRTVNQGGAWAQCTLPAAVALPNVSFNGVHGDGTLDNRIFVVGAGGTVVYSPGGIQDDFVNRSGGAVPAVDLYDAYVTPGVGGDVFACGTLSGGNAAVVFSAAGDGSDFVNQTDVDTGQQTLRTVFGVGTTYRCAGGNGGNKDNLNGIIITTADSGATWIQNIAQEASAAPNNNHLWTQLNGVSTYDGQRLVAVGEIPGGANPNGIALHSTNGGNTWTLLDSGTANALNGVWYLDATHAYAVGDSGASVLFNGTAWADNNTAGLGGHNYFGVHGFNSTEYYACGYDGAANGRVARNQGAGWAAINLAGNNQLNSIYTSGSKVYVCGENGQIWKYTSGAAWAAGSWTNIATGVTATDDLKAITVSGSSLLVAGDDAGGNGVVYFSGDDGTSWTRNTATFTGNPLKSLCPVNSNNCAYAVGDNGKIYFYNTGTSTWTDVSAVNNPTIKDLRGVTGYLNDYFVVGEFDTILKNE